MKFIKIHIFFGILSVLFHFQTGAQVIGGKVVQIHDQKTIPYTTLAIEGATVGTVSDFNGNFVLEIPDEHVNKSVIVSCVGYKEKKVKIKPLIGKLDLVIELEAVNVEIEEVVIEQKSLLPYSIIKKAVNAADENYINRAYNYEFYYKNTDNYYKENDRVREAVVKFHDSKGYGPSSIIESFQEINYRFLYSKRNFPVNDINSGNTNLDNLLEFDIARHHSNITDKRRIYDFDIVLKDEIEYKGDSVWVLVYQCQDPALIHTGDFSVESYIGEMFIHKKDYAILYNTTTVKTKKPSFLSRNLYADTYYTPQNLSSAHYTFETFYGKRNGNYVPEKILYEINYSYTSKENNSLISTESEMRLLNAALENPEVINMREYYEDLAPDPDFWDSFEY